jgi:hypothetical protein
MEEERQIEPRREAEVAMLGRGDVQRASRYHLSVLR